MNLLIDSDFSAIDENYEFLKALEFKTDGDDEFDSSVKMYVWGQFFLRPPFALPITQKNYALREHQISPP
jgi:hypothetical protein